MALNPFNDKQHCPEPADLPGILGVTLNFWRHLINDIFADHAPIDEVWNYGGAKIGWTLRLKRKDGIVVYLIPQHGHFLAAIVLGEKAVGAARTPGLPQKLYDLIDAARPYAEGRGIRLPITSLKDVAAIRELAAATMAP